MRAVSSMARHLRPCPSDAFPLLQSCQFRRRCTNNTSALPSSRRLLHYHYVVDPPPPLIPTVPIYGQPDTVVFPVHRIYCVGGLNYGEKQAEKKIWGVRFKIKDPVRERPFFFLKPADAIVPCDSTTTSATSGKRGRHHRHHAPRPAVTTTASHTIPYPSATTNLRYEVELVVALSSATTIYGYAVGVDLTRRDWQVSAKIQSRPWCSAKSFDRSAPISAIRPLLLMTTTTTTTTTGTTTTTTKNGNHHHEDEANNNTPDGTMWLRVNGVQRQAAKPRTDMIHSVTELIAALGEEFELTGGDLLYTGTPAHGVGPLVVGDTVTAGFDGVGELSFTMV